MELDYYELIWFVSTTVLINSLVFVLCGILELVGRYDLFKEARILKKASKNVHKTFS